jgi:hypothetical protein
MPKTAETTARLHKRCIKWRSKSPRSISVINFEEQKRPAPDRSIRRWFDLTDL